jgi:hypothetical protein
VTENNGVQDLATELPPCPARCAELALDAYLSVSFILAHVVSPAGRHHAELQ